MVKFIRVISIRDLTLKTALYESNKEKEMKV